MIWRKKMAELEQLLFALPFKEIDWRVGSTTQDKSKGLALGYIDARDLMERLDDVVGGSNWQTYDKKDGDTYYCQLSVMNCTKTGGAGATDVEGEKGGSSDAFKRAGYLFGIGRYLYNLKGVWVPIKQYGKSYAIDRDNEETKRALNAALIKVSGEAVMAVLDKVINLQVLSELTSRNVYLEALSIFNDAGKERINNRVNQLKGALK